MPQCHVYVGKQVKMLDEYSVMVRDLRYTSLKKGDMICSLRNIFNSPTRNSPHLASLND